MKVHTVKIEEMEDNYLMELLRQEQTSNPQAVIKELKTRLERLTPSTLLTQWTREKNLTLKEILEVTIAKKYTTVQSVTPEEKVPNLIRTYFEEVTSLDAINILLQTRNQNLKGVVEEKYDKLLESYLKYEENMDLYELEGDDRLRMTARSSNVIPFKVEQKRKGTIQKANAKIYQFKRK